MNHQANPFAPGAIEHHESPRRKATRRLLKSTAEAAIVVAIAVGIFALITS